MTTKALDVTAANGNQFRFVLLPDGRSLNYPGPAFTETGGLLGIAVVRNNGNPTVEVYERTPSAWNLRYGFGTPDGNYITGGWLAATLPGGKVLDTYPGGMAAWAVDADTMTRVREWLDTMLTE